jgi:hypothetical protein
MVMGSGLTITKLKTTRDATEWIRSKDSVFTNGQVARPIKASSEKTTGRVTADSTSSHQRCQLEH